MKSFQIHALINSCSFGQFEQSFDFQHRDGIHDCSVLHDIISSCLCLLRVRITRVCHHSLQWPVDLSQYHHRDTRGTCPASCASTALTCVCGDLGIGLRYIQILSTHLRSLTLDKLPEDREQMNQFLPSRDPLNTATYTTASMQ